MTKENLLPAHVSDGSTMTVSPPDNNDDGFITPRGPTTPLASAVPQVIATYAVPMSNQFNELHNSTLVTKIIRGADHVIYYFTSSVKNQENCIGTQYKTPI